MIVTNYWMNYKKQAHKNKLIVHILIQVNIAREESKHGFDENEIVQVMEYMKKCPSLIVDGLMVMALNIQNARKNKNLFSKNKRFT